MQGNTVAKLDRAETVGQVSAPNIILRNDIKANKIEIFGDAEVNKPCEVYRKDAKDANDEYSLNILFQEGNVEKMRQNVH
jgi:catabolite regulation protein CreA